MTGQEESDQLPEEGPGSQVPDDDGDGNTSARGDAEKNAGGTDETDEDEGQATGNPANAG